VPPRGSPHNCPPPNQEGPPKQNPPAKWGCGPFRVQSFELPMDDHGWRSLIITGAQLQWFWFCAQTNSGSVHLSTEVLNHHNIVDPLNVSHSASTTVSLIYHIRARHRNETNVWEFRYRVNENNTGPVNVRFAARLGFVNELGFTS
jgi:hypothetical protein